MRQPPPAQRRVPGPVIDGLFLLGAGLVAAGLWLVWPPLALIVLGLVAMAIAWVVGSGTRQLPAAVSDVVDDDEGLD